MRTLALLVFASLASVAACGPAKDSVPSGSPPAKVVVPPPIDVPAAGASLRVVQRTHAPLPGSHDKIDVALGDITGGRVHLIVTQVGTPASALATADVGEGDTVKFAVDGHGYALRVAAMRNVLVGDDWVDLLLTADQPAQAEPTAPVDEHARIESLLARVESSGIVFIRNGSEHTAKEAADHLRDKWSNAGDRIGTAEDFIEQLASRSSQSGKAYRVRLPDGTELDSGPWLREQLAALGP